MSHPLVCIFSSALTSIKSIRFHLSLSLTFRSVSFMHLQCSALTMRTFAYSFMFRQFMTNTDILNIRLHW